MIKWLVWTIWTSLPVVRKRLLNLITHSLSVMPHLSIWWCSCTNEWPLLWRLNGCGSVSNHQPHDCLLSRLFRHRSKKTSKLHVTGLCEGNSPGTAEFPAQRAINVENDSIWWRHHAITHWNWVHQCHGNWYILHHCTKWGNLSEYPYIFWHLWINVCLCHGMFRGAMHVFYKWDFTCYVYDANGRATIKHSYIEICCFFVLWNDNFSPW